MEQPKLEHFTDFFKFCEAYEHWVKNDPEIQAFTKALQEWAKDWKDPDEEDDVSDQYQK